MKKKGKWSNTTYYLELAPGVRPLYFLSPMHGTWGDNLPSWGAVAEKLQLPVTVAQEIVRREYPSTAKRLDNLEVFAAELAETNHDVEVVVISFGSPTNRQIREGYWSQPKRGYTSTGQEVIVERGDDGWAKPVVVTPEGAQIVSSQHIPGMHGGCWAIEVAVPAVPMEKEG